MGGGRGGAGGRAGVRTGLKHPIRISVFGKLTKMLTCSMTNIVQMSARLCERGPSLSSQHAGPLLRQKHTMKGTMAGFQRAALIVPRSRRANCCAETIRAWPGSHVFLPFNWELGLGIGMR